MPGNRRVRTSIPQGRVPDDAVSPLAPSWLQSQRAWSLLVGATAVLLYVPTVGFGWVYDDQMEIVHNLFVHSLEHLPRLFTSTVWAGSGMETYLYRPLALVTYALNYQVSGLHPWSYHLVNVLLHGGVSVLVFRLGVAWGLPLAAAGVGSLLFAVHPAHVEPVAAVFGRKDLLATAFTLLMVLGHLRARAGGGWIVVLPPLAFGAALLSKEVGMVGLLLVGVHDLILERNRQRLLQDARTAGLYAAYLGILLLYLLVRAQVAGTGGVPETSLFDNPLAGANPFTRMATALVVVGKGLTLLILPISLSPDYSYNAIPLARSFGDPRLLTASVLVGVLAALGLAARRRRLEEGRHTEEGGRSERGPWKADAVLLALAWYIVGVFPTSNLLVTTGTIFGERLLYLPSVSFCLLGAVALHQLWRHPRAAVVRAGALVTILVLASFSAQSFRYARVWDNDLSLFRWAASSVPASTKAHHKLGEELLREGSLGDALRALTTALDIAPENPFAAVTMGLARQAVAERFLPPPEGRGEAGTPPKDPDILYVLGQIRRDQGDLRAAESYWGEALMADPGHAESLADLGLIRLLAADTATALEHLRRAVSEKPSLAATWYNLGRILLARGEVEEGRTALLHFLSAAGSRFPREALWARQVLDEIEAR